MPIFSKKRVTLQVWGRQVQDNMDLYLLMWGLQIRQDNPNWVLLRLRIESIPSTSKIWQFKAQISKALRQKKLKVNLERFLNNLDKLLMSLSMGQESLPSLDLDKSRALARATSFIERSTLRQAKDHLYLVLIIGMHR